MRMEKGRGIKRKEINPASSLLVATRLRRAYRKWRQELFRSVERVRLSRISLPDLVYRRPLARGEGEDLEPVPNDLSCTPMQRMYGGTIFFEEDARSTDSGGPRFLEGRRSRAIDQSIEEIFCVLGRRRKRGNSCK